MTVRGPWTNPPPDPDPEPERPVFWDGDRGRLLDKHDGLGDLRLFWRMIWGSRLLKISMYLFIAYSFWETYQTFRKIDWSLDTVLDMLEITWPGLIVPTLMLIYHMMKRRWKPPTDSGP